jgi:hypothetical protein
MMQVRARIFPLVLGAAVGVALFVSVRASEESPVFGVSIPPGYRAWQLVQVHSATGVLKAIWGNPIAIRAYLHKTLPFPDGTILVKQTWRSVALNSVPAANISGPQDHIQVMVKEFEEVRENTWLGLW